MGVSFENMNSGTDRSAKEGPENGMQVQVDTTRAARVSLVELEYRNSGLDDLAFQALDPASDLNQGARGPWLAAALARMGLTEPVAVQALLRNALARASRLRHASVVRGADASRWIAGVFLTEPQRLLWHINRLDGVSPSSAWTYVAERLGQRSWWSTARDLDRTRLMMLLPEPPDWHCLRGTHLEPLARKLLYAMNGDRIESDIGAIKRAAQVKGVPGMPWLIGNPDDIVRIKMGRSQGQHRINDFKCPAELPEPDADVDPQYKTQLHLYRILGAPAGIEASSGMLTHLGVGEALARMWVFQLSQDPTRLSRIAADAQELMEAGHDLVQMRFQRVPFEPEFEHTIIEACHEADHRIQNGQIAPYPKKPRVELSESDLFYARNLAARLADTICTRERLQEVETALKSHLAAIYSQTETNGKDAGLGLISLQTPTYLDKGRAIEALKRAQVPVESFGARSESVAYDSPRLRKALVKAGLDPSEYETREIRLGLAKNPKGATARRIDQIRAEAHERLDPLVNAIREAMDRHPAPGDPVSGFATDGESMEMNS